MSQRKILGYSIYFKDAKEAETFYNKVSENFQATLDIEEREVTLIGVDKVNKEDFSYVFRKDGRKISVEPLKIISLQTLFARE